MTISRNIIKWKLFFFMLLAAINAFGDTSNTFIKVIINNQLSHDIKAEFLPMSYDKNKWNGKCTENNVDIIYSTTDKQLCSQTPELMNGIPVGLPWSHTDNNDDSQISFPDKQTGLLWFLSPFKGHIVLKTADDEPVADIQYSMEGHDAAYLNKFTHHFHLERGQFVMWKPLKILSRNPNVHLQIKDSDPSGDNWCHFSDQTGDIDTSQRLCNATYIITVR